ncbi:MAG: response regulator, partial [Rhodobacterales bacterium]|nr:response regulator [Rhodobacterales bacterium]
MSRLANVLVASADTARQGVLVDILAENQCSALGCDTADELMSLARSTHPDLILIDMADPSMDGLAVARNLRAEGRRPDSPMPAAPIMVIASQRRADLYEDALAMGVEDVLVDPLDDAELMCRIWPLLRLSTIATEVEGRIRAATALGAAVPPDGDDGSDLPGSVLVLRDTAVTQESQVPLPYGGGFTFVSAVSNRDAERLLSKQAFDAVVLVAVDGDGAERMLAFCELLRSKPNLYDLPVILIAPKAAITDRSDPYWRGVTRLVLAPAPHQEIEYGLSGLTARKRRRWSLRRALDRIRVPDLCDPVTKLYGEPFLRANLGILVEDARTWHRRLSL